MRSTFLIACFLLTFVIGASADPLIKRAAEREKAGDREASAALLSSWLEANPGASGSPEVFAAYIRVEQNLPTLLAVSRQFLISVKGVPSSAPQFYKVARLFDLSGRIEEARDAYLAAYGEGAPEAALISAFLLSFQMNDADSMTATLQKLAGNGGSADLLLQALSDMRRGDRTAARSSLIAVADQTGNPDLALKALWILYQADVNSGDPSAGGMWRSKLKSRFAASPEAAIVAAPAAPGSKTVRAVVVEMPTPVRIDDSSPITAPMAATAPSQATAAPAASTHAPLGPQQQPVQAAPTPAPPTASSVSTTPGSVSSTKVSVQAGSFLMKENADDLLSELLKRGFAPLLVRDTAQGKDRYRVLAGTGLETEAARAILKRLSDDGFKGFIVPDR